MSDWSSSDSWDDEPVPVRKVVIGRGGCRSVGTGGGLGAAVHAGGPGSIGYRGYPDGEVSPRAPTLADGGQSRNEGHADDRGGARRPSARGDGVDGGGRGHGRSVGRGGGSGPWRGGGGRGRGGHRDDDRNREDSQDDGGGRGGLWEEYRNREDFDCRNREDSRYDSRNREDCRDDGRRTRRQGRCGDGDGARGGRCDQDEDSDDGGCFRGRRRDEDCNRRGRVVRGGAHDGGDERHQDQRHYDWEGNEKPKPVTYVPPQPTDNPEELFSSGIKSGINFSKYDKITVRVSGRNAPAPVTSIEEADMGTVLTENVRRSGYTKLTPVQKYSLPIVMAGRDLMACAQTGSGKTAGFLLPILDTLTAEAGAGARGRSDPLAVVVCPTRELAIQIFTEARKYAHELDLNVRLAYGGAAVGYQADLIRSGCDVLVATPGRLMDFVSRGLVNFGALRFFVLDEADRMLDLGFLPAVEEMMTHPTMPAKGRRQTLMFSATFPDEVQRLAHRFLHDFIFLAVGPVGGANADVAQTILELSGENNKREALTDALSRQGKSEKTLVFVETKKKTDALASYLSLKSFPATSIHGDREQREREEALRDFTTGAMQVLVATAVAARGLDIKGVTHVVNYDMPDSIEEYVHRIGRTGRVGNVGRATSFFNSARDADIAAGLAKILRDADQEVPTFLNEYTFVAEHPRARNDIRGGVGITTYVLEAEDEDW